ncbi:MAG TPA: glycosyltransferase [Polyangia bacterium]|nr:glycosyltransferase [Polyangia bacterium]
MVPTPVGPLVVPEAAPGGPPLRLSLVIPTFNESKNVGELVARLGELLDDRLGREAYELIVVDDDSRDRTWEVALALAEKHPQVRVIRRVGERGLSTAVIRGWQAARGELLAVIDADLQHPPEVVGELLARMEAGADLAVASRNVDGGGVSNWSLHRRALSRGAQLLGLLLLPGVLGRVSDPMSGYFMLRRRVLAGVTLSPLGYKILIEVIGRGRVATVAEVGYVFRERLEGESKVTWRLYLEYLRHLVRLRFARVPLGRLARFALVGTTGLAVDMGLLYLLSDPSSLGWGLTRSKLCAAEAAIVNNFLWNDLWTFRDLAARQRGRRHRLRRLMKFNVICGIGLVMNVVLLNLLFNLLHMNRYLANLVAIGVVTLWNFWVNLKLSWRDTGAPEPAAPGPARGL